MLAYRPSKDKHCDFVPASFPRPTCCGPETRKLVTTWAPEGSIAHSVSERRLVTTHPSVVIILITRADRRQKKNELRLVVSLHMFVPL